MKKQNKKMFYYRDLLQKHLKKKELENLLEYNNQEIPVGQVLRPFFSSCNTREESKPLLVKKKMGSPY